MNDSLDARLQDGIGKHQSGDRRRAEIIYRSILQESPSHAGAWHMLGLLSFQQKRYEQAKVEIERALALCDTKAVYHNNHGAVLRELGQHNEAKTAFQKALDIRPNYPDALSNLALSQRDSGELSEAYETFRRVLEMDPSHANSLRYIGKLCRGLDRLDEALLHFKRLVQQLPEDFEGWINLAQLFASSKQAASSVNAYRQAVRIRPQDANVRKAFANSLSSYGDVTEAKVQFAEAARLQPDRSSWRFLHLEHLPHVFQSQNTLQESLDQLDRALDEAKQASFSFDWRSAYQDGFCPPFGLSHQGQCCRALKEKFAALFAPHFPQERPRARETDRLRIGFLVPEGRARGFLRISTILVSGLNRDRFEPVIVCPEQDLELCRREIASHDVGWAPYPHDFEQSVAAITSARCDILYHHQIGTAVTNYFLPFARCAPVQCTGWGTHGTSGISAVDHYLSSNLIEIEGAEDHYTEQLFRFHDALPTCQCRVAPPKPASREDFGLPGRSGIYFCPQRIEKLHPEFDSLLRGILESDAEGTIIMLKGSHPQAFGQLIKRFQRTLGHRLLKRMVFAPSLSVNQYLRVLSLADVVLDTPNYSTSLTGLDAISLGVPIITLPGTRKLERYASALYRMIGFEDLIVSSQEDYIRTAVRLGTDSAYRHHMHVTIQSRSDMLFENRKSIEEHERFFEFAWANQKQLL